MDIAAKRASIAAAAVACEFNAYDFQPDNPGDLPAAVVGGITLYERLNASVARVQLVVTLYASSSDAQDATRCLDTALSTNVANSFIDAVSAIDGMTVDSAGAYQQFVMPTGTALGVPITIQIVSR